MYSLTLKRKIQMGTMLIIIAAGLAFSFSAIDSQASSESKSDRTESAALAMSQMTQAFARYDSEGALIRPVGYREWVYIGTPLTPNDMNGGNAAFPEFHNVYVDPVSWAEYKKSGEFPDGTVVIKELVSVGGKSASSGKGYFMGEFVGLEAAVKDSKRFPKEANGWAYFSFGHSYPLEKKVKAQAQASCAQCHLTAPGGSMVFSQYYPVLRARAVSAK